MTDCYGPNAFDMATMTFDSFANAVGAFGDLIDSSKRPKLTRAQIEKLPRCEQVEYRRAISAGVVDGSKGEGWQI